MKKKLWALIPLLFVFVFSLYYVVSNNKYGKYRVMIYEGDFSKSFRLK